MLYLPSEGKCYGKNLHTRNGAFDHKVLSVLFLKTIFKDFSKVYITLVYLLKHFWVYVILPVST